ncbi:MAG: TRAP transporter substrate-binding protein DctP [Syntrophales bacterium]|nr:TRAP transporter substrate-binding protein DctP [Syntrophales bacterium]
MRLGVKIATMAVMVCLIVSLVLGGCSAPAPTTTAPAATSAAPATTAAPTVIKWKGQYSYPTTVQYGPFKSPKTAGLNALTLTWTEWLTKATNGRIQIEWAEPGAIYPVADTDKAVGEGLVQVAMPSGMYYRGRFPEGDIEAGGIMLYVDDRDMYDCFYNAGLYEALQKVYKDKLKVVYYPIFAQSETSIGTTFDIPTLDSLKGKKIRAVGVQADFIQALGGSPTMVALGEVYQAMKLGTVDGWVAATAQLETGKLKEVTKGWVTNPLMSLTPSNVIINQKAFDALPADLKKILQEQSQYASYTTSTAWGNQNQYALEQAQNYGVKTFAWSAADQERATQIAKTAIWPKLAGATPEAKMLMDVIMKWRASWGRETL